LLEIDLGNLRPFTGISTTVVTLESGGVRSLHCAFVQYIINLEIIVWAVNCATLVQVVANVNGGNSTVVSTDYSLMNWHRYKFLPCLSWYHVATQVLCPART